ncbi:hypothetical protein D3C71_1415130 [compost metagenome]
MHVDSSRLSQDVHVLPSLPLRRLAPNRTREIGVVDLGDHRRNVPIAVVEHGEDDVAVLHLIPHGNVALARHRTPRIEILRVRQQRPQVVDLLCRQVRIKE